MLSDLHYLGRNRDALLLRKVDPEVVRKIEQQRFNLGAIEKRAGTLVPAQSLPMLKLVLHRRQSSLLASRCDRFT